MKKVMFHINSMGKGGAERVVAVLSKYFVSDEYEVVISTEWEAEEEYLLDDRVKRINVGLTEEELKKNRLKKIILRIMKYRKAIQEEKPDIVISFCAKANFRSAYALTGLSIPLLVSVRNDPQIDYAPHALATKYMERKAAGCVFQTEQAKLFFDKRFQKKGKIIWNPLSDRFLEIPSNEHKEKKQAIVTVGRITKQKNQMLLLEGFKQIKTYHPDYELWIFGEDGMDGTKAELEKYIEQEQLEDSVFLKGVCKNVEQEISKAQIFVLSSDYEGMPNALLEAMAIGMPVVATDCPCGGPATLIENGKSGLLVPTKDKSALVEAIDKLIQDSDYAQKLGKQARCVKQKSHPDKVYQEWKKYVEELT